MRHDTTPTITTATVPATQPSMPEHCPTTIIIDGDLEQRLVGARQAVASVPGAVSMTIEARGCISWPFEALHEQGVELDDSLEHLNNASYADVGSSGIVFYAESAQGVSGESLDTLLVSFETLREALETGHSDNRGDLIAHATG